MLISLFLHVLAFLGGLAIVAGTVFSAMRTFVLPRSASDPLTRLVFLIIRYLFAPLLIRARTHIERDTRYGPLRPALPPGASANLVFAGGPGLHRHILEFGRWLVV